MKINRRNHTVKTYFYKNWLISINYSIIRLSIMIGNESTSKTID